MCQSTSLCEAFHCAYSKSALLRFTISQMGSSQFLLCSEDPPWGRSDSLLSSLSSATCITGVQFATFVPRPIMCGSVLTLITLTGTEGPSVFTKVRPTTKSGVDCPASSSTRP